MSARGKSFGLSSDDIHLIAEGGKAFRKRMDSYRDEQNAIAERLAEYNETVAREDARLESARTLLSAEREAFETDKSIALTALSEREEIHKKEMDTDLHKAEQRRKELNALEEALLAESHKLADRKAEVAILESSLDRRKRALDEKEKALEGKDADLKRRESEHADKVRDLGVKKNELAKIVKEKRELDARLEGFDLTGIE